MSLMRVALEKFLGKKLVELLSSIGDLSASMGVGSYLVGGVVRDLFFDVCTKKFDIDIMFDKDGPKIARHLKENWNSCCKGFSAPEKIVVFSRYGTGKLLFPLEVVPGVDHMDFSTARSESYPSPGARPEVSSGDLHSDMARRDFAINAMCVGLLPEEFGKLYDFFGGKADIEAKEINVLHDKSFEEDPVRLIRAIRFASRFGCFFGEKTDRLFKEGIKGGYLNRISPERLFDEIRKALSDPDAASIVCLLDERGLLQQVFPGRELGQDTMHRIASCPDGPEGWMDVLAELFSDMSLERYRDMLSRFCVSRRDMERLLRAKEERGQGDVH